MSNGCLTNIYLYTLLNVIKEKTVAKLILGGIVVEVEFLSSAHTAWPYSFRETE